MEGISKLTKYEKIAWVNKTYLQDYKSSLKQIEQYWVNDIDLQKIHDEFSENTISNFLLPLGLAPNFLIDGKDYTIPMAIEESSVVAAACKAAKFWRKRGGFKTKIIDFKNIEKILVILSDDELFTSLFYEVFLENISNYPSLTKVSFVYSVDEINAPINNTLIIGPVNSSDLSLLPPLLGNDTFILTLSNDAFCKYFLGRL